MAYLNWQPVVMSLLFNLQGAGFDLRAVDDGDGSTRLDSSQSKLQQRLAAADIAAAVDVAKVFVCKGDKHGCLLLVLGNEPDELVADYGGAPALMPELELAIDRFSARWEGRPCPRH